MRGTAEHARGRRKGGGRTQVRHGAVAPGTSPAGWGNASCASAGVHWHDETIPTAGGRKDLRNPVARGISLDRNGWRRTAPVGLRRLDRGHCRPAPSLRWFAPLRTEPSPHGSGRPRPEVAAAESTPSCGEAGAYGETRVGPIVCVKYRESLLYGRHYCMATAASGKSRHNLITNVGREQCDVGRRLHLGVDPCAR